MEEVKNMFNKTKTGIVAFVLASFFVGGFAFNAYQVGAAEDGSGHEFGFFRGGFGGFSGINKDSPEWQAKMEEWKIKTEERKAEMEEFQAMTPEERQAKMEELMANRPENGEWEDRGLRSRHFFGFGFKGLNGYADEVNYEVVNLDNGVQITITSDDSDIVQKLQDRAVRCNNSNE